MKLKKYDEVEYLDNLTSPIYEIMEQANQDSLSVIANRINKIGKLTPTDASKLSVLYKRADLVEIERILSDATKLSLIELDSIIGEAAKENDRLAEEMYKAKNVNQLGYLENAKMQSIIATAKASMTDNILNLSQTKAFMIDGRTTTLANTYNSVVNRAIYEVESGLTDYNTAMRSTISKLSDSGIRTVDYASGYSRRLDSSVRMNVLDGFRRMNADYRQAQGEEYGSDVIYVSYHALPADDHAHINGKEYTKAEWETVSSGLIRQVGTQNCKHFLTYGIKGVTENPITEQQRESAIDNSEKEVSYTNLNGAKVTTSKYAFSQRQRNVETSIRRMKDKQLLFERSGDTIQSNKLSKEIREKTKYYKNMSAEGGLEPKLERLRIVK